jgi:hypothetical protein
VVLLHKLHVGQYRHDETTICLVFVSLFIVELSDEVSEAIIDRLRRHLAIEQTPIEGEEIATLSLGNDEHDEFFKYKIYVTTFLNYGANQAFDRYIERIIKQGQE